MSKPPNKQNQETKNKCTGIGCWTVRKQNVYEKRNAVRSPPSRSGNEYENFRRKDDVEYGLSITERGALKHSQARFKLISAHFLQNYKLEEVWALQGLRRADREKNLFVWVNKCSQHTGLLGTSELHEVLRHRVNKELCLQFHKYQVQAADISILSRPAFTLEHASYIKMLVYVLSGSSIFLVYPPVNSWGYEMLCIDPRLARSYNCCLENQNNNCFHPS